MKFHRPWEDNHEDQQSEDEKKDQRTVRKQNYKNWTREQKKRENESVIKYRRETMEIDPELRKRIQEQKTKSRKNCLNKMTAEEKIIFNEQNAKIYSKYIREQKRILSIPMDQATPEELAKQEEIKRRKKKKLANQRLRYHKLKEEKRMKNREEPNSSDTEVGTNDQNGKDDSRVSTVFESDALVVGDDTLESQQRGSKAKIMEKLRDPDIVKEQRRSYNKNSDASRQRRMKADPVYKKKINEQKARSLRNRINKMTPDEKSRYIQRNAGYKSKHREEMKRILSISIDQATPEELAKLEKIEEQKKKHAESNKRRRQKLKDLGNLNDSTSNGTEHAARDKMESDPSCSANSNNKMPESRKRKLPVDQDPSVDHIEGLMNEENVEDLSSSIKNETLEVDEDLTDEENVDPSPVYTHQQFLVQTLDRWFSS